MKKICLVFMLIAVFVFGQNENTSKKFGFYTNVDANIGYDLASVLSSDKGKTEYEISQEPPRKFNYGFTSTVGFQPINWFLLGSGFRYSYIDPNYHLIYFLVQPQFIINDVQEDDPLFIKLNFGKQINKSVTNNAGFIGLSFGKLEVLKPHLSHYFQLNIESQALKEDNVFFVGFSYGIQFFSNKNFTSN